MKERPILFSAPMVRAILDGRKTQTRRIVNRVGGIGQVTEFQRSDTAGYDWSMRDKHMRWHEFTNAEMLERCPYGKPGERLWVRETFSIPGGYFDDYEIDEIKNGLLDIRNIVHYKADAPESVPCDGGWQPSIHMPRIASRILLEVKNVRVERLKDISECDAKAEGSYVCDYFGRRLLDQSSNQGCYKWGYRSIWESLNGSGSWDLNPFVWVVEFKVLEVKK